MREVCYCDYSACGYCCAIGVIHKGTKSGGGLVTFFPMGGYCCHQLAIGAKSGGKLVHFLTVAVMMV